MAQDYFFDGAGGPGDDPSFRPEDGYLSSPPNGRSYPKRSVLAGQVLDKADVVVLYPRTGVQKSRILGHRWLEAPHCDFFYRCRTVDNREHCFSITAEMVRSIRHCADTGLRSTSYGVIVMLGCEVLVDDELAFNINQFADYVNRVGYWNGA